ncbi:hypothetical protein [Allomuricauda sp. SCSIO 65647]|uniref:hypothetical protein n=1 Tax=Allomuricauda sp. SCSIO 65647 TaxID=2908843 RepID=UPI001F253A36|nr:hypothetical protein [Muricauda sp. SCSIO 65647]UJH68729.1 hypothetical protein L0P89_05815 [Muricauda sp. SCSIO 65647]
MKNHYASLILSLALTLVSCNSDDNSPTSDICDFLGIVSNSQFNNTNTDNYVIQSVDLQGDCLQIEIASGGCDGDSWKVRLIGAANVDDSLPPMRSIILRLDNQELCEAFITKTYSFELTPFRDSGDSILLRLEGWEDPILYSF